jgi:hypothetical protein
LAHTASDVPRHQSFYESRRISEWPPAAQVQQERLAPDRAFVYRIIGILWGAAVIAEPRGTAYPRSNRHTVTTPVVIGFLAIPNRHIGRRL